MNNEIVGRVEGFVFPFVGENRHGAAGFVSHNASSSVLARKLSPFPIERVSVAVVGRVAKNANVAIIRDPPVLNIVRNITPNQVTTDAAPGWTFRPHRSGEQPLYGSITDPVFGEPLVQNNYVRIGITHGWS